MQEASSRLGQTDSVENTNNAYNKGDNKDLDNVHVSENELKSPGRSGSEEDKRVNIFIWSLLLAAPSFTFIKCQS